MVWLMTKSRRRRFAKGEARQRSFCCCCALSMLSSGPERERDRKDVGRKGAKDWRTRRRRKKKRGEDRVRCLLFCCCCRCRCWLPCSFWFVCCRYASGQCFFFASSSPHLSRPPSSPLPSRAAWLCICILFVDARPSVVYVCVFEALAACLFYTICSLLYVCLSLCVCLYVSLPFFYYLMGCLRSLLDSAIFSNQKSCSSLSR